MQILAWFKIQVTEVIYNLLLKNTPYLWSEDEIFRLFLFFCRMIKSLIWDLLQNLSTCNPDLPHSNIWIGLKYRNLFFLTVIDEFIWF